jgi:mono/diheme cytochrome c family protein
MLPRRESVVVLVGIGALGQAVYAQHCASCHGPKLDGQPNWQERGANGRLPAPPHDATGHTWHHPDRQLFGLTKKGVSGILPGYKSDMPAFGNTLSDREICAALAFTRSAAGREPRDLTRIGHESLEVFRSVPKLHRHHENRRTLRERRTLIVP